MMRKKKDTEPVLSAISDVQSGSFAFEATLKALRPFMKGYGITSDRSVKLRIADDVDATALDTAINGTPDNSVKWSINGKNGTAFVLFGDMPVEDAAAIVARVFGEGNNANP